MAIDAKQLFDTERNIPYRIPLTCEEKDHCCSGKHERLLAAFTDAGFEARYRVCWFRWSDLQISTDVASVPHEDDCTHVYLELKMSDVWKIVDATWDPGLASVLPVNEWVEGQDMQVAVPAVKTLSPEESDKYIRALTAHDAEIDMQKHRAFYQALNAWFERVRKIS